MSDDHQGEPSTDAEPAPDEALDLTNPATQQKFKRRKDRVEHEQAEFYRRVFSSRVGRREMYEILKATGYFETKFGVGPAGFPQPEASWFHAGAKDIGQRLYHTWLRLCPEAVNLMLFEHHPDLHNEARRRGLK